MLSHHRRSTLFPYTTLFRSELGINLMRLGQTEEPLQQLEMCYDNGYRDAATVNSLRLLDSYKNFLTFRDDRSIIRLDRKSTRLNSSHMSISYAVFCLKKKIK